MDIKNKTSNFLIRNIVSENYIREMSHIPMLTAQEERELFIKYEESQNRVKAALGTDNYTMVKATEEALQDEIRNEIISRNQRFNFAVAKRYDNKDIIMDLVSVGAIGMYEAFQKYNYKEDVRFCSFAIWYIRRAINAYLMKENLMVRTTNDSKLLPKVKRIESTFFAAEGRYPTVSEIKTILEKKYNIKDVDMADLFMVTTVSINEGPADDEVTLEDVSEYAIATASYNEYEATAKNDDLKYRLNMELKKLTDRERIIICMSSGYGYDKEYKDQEIAEELNLTSERIRQIKLSVRKKMMKSMTATSKMF